MNELLFKPLLLLLLLLPIIWSEEDGVGGTGTLIGGVLQLICGW